MTTDQASAYETLAPRQKTFIDGIVSGLSQAEAYRAAGYSEKGATASASRMLAKVNVASALMERRQPAVKLAAWDRDRLTAEWLTNLRLARDAGHHAASNTALTALAKHIGLDAPALLQPGKAGVTLTATLSVPELRAFVEVLRLKEAGELPAIDVLPVLADAGAGDASGEGSGDGDAGGG